MTWTNPPALLTALRSDLALSASWISAGGAEAQVHYPDIDPRTIDNFPAVALVRMPVSYSKYAVGVKPLPGGTIQMDIYDIDTDVGTLETLADAIAEEICQNPSVVNLEVEEVSEAEGPSEAEQAANSDNPDYKALYKITIIFTYGLEF